MKRYWPLAIVLMVLAMLGLIAITGDIPDEEIPYAAAVKD